jgi:bifunctional DNA-binding transcriptional regulator/antitoxin component of YhaV-PrlF toxin-antitoxin module
MKATIVVDEVGRIVLPKHIREAIGVRGRTVLEAEVVNGSVQIGPPEKAGCLKREGSRRVFTGTLPEDWDSGEAVLRERARRAQR